MSLSLIGAVFAAIGAVSMFWTRLATFRVLCVAVLFGAASAIVMGPANITPGHLVLGLFGLAFALRQNGLESLAVQMSFPKAGFYLLLITVWSVFSAMIFPRIFSGLVYVIPVSTQLPVYVAQPLGPSSSNITQSIYMIGNLVAFCGAAALVRTHKLFLSAAFALLVAGYINLAIAVLDSVTYTAGVPHLLDFMRNADYAQAYSALVLGMKRITGSFPEASSFATFSVGLFAFAFRLWRGGVHTVYSGYLALGTFMAIMLAFSSSGYVALGVYMVMIYSRNLAGIDVVKGLPNQTGTQRRLFIALGPLAALIVGIIAAFRPDILDPITAMFDDSITTKLSSDSGEERMAWNMGGISNFLGTYGLGVGLGGVRVSSILIGIPANIGIVGTLLMVVFFIRVFTVPNHLQWVKQTEFGQVQAAGRSACFAILIGAAISATTMDLGLLFYICAGLACAPAIPYGKLGGAYPENPPKSIRASLP